jgi:hypothetical protein
MENGFHHKRGVSRMSSLSKKKGVFQLKRGVSFDRQAPVQYIVKALYEYSGKGGEAEERGNVDYN